jgi:hypothetical protein
MDEEQRQQTSEKTYLSVVPPINNTTREKVAANESTVMIPLPTAATPVAPLLPDHQNVPTPPVTRKKMYSFVPQPAPCRHLWSDKHYHHRHLRRSDG